MPTTIDHGDPALSRLVKQIRATGDSAWAEGYFELARVLLDELGLDSEDPRLNMSIPKNATRWVLPVTINNRYVLAVRREGSACSVGAIWASDFDRRAHLRPLTVGVGRYDALRGEDIFSVPFFLSITRPDPLAVTDELRGGWLSAAKYELERASASPFRRFHSEHAYRAVVDPQERTRLIAAAFAV